MQNDKFIEKVKDYLYGSNATVTKMVNILSTWDYDENVKEVEIYDVELSEELGESLPCPRLCLTLKK